MRMHEEPLVVRRRQGPAEINVAPLLDMVFILLIFFVITTTFSRQTGVDVTKPQAQSAQFQGDQTLMVGISREGTIHVHGKQVSSEALSQIVSRELVRRGDLSVVIVADRSSELGRSIEVMDICTMAGVARVSVAADRK